MLVSERSRITTLAGLRGHTIGVTIRPMSNQSVF